MRPRPRRAASCRAPSMTRCIAPACLRCWRQQHAAGLNFICMRVWEAIARFDASAAWNLVMNQAIAAFAAWLPAGGVEDLFRNGLTTVAGARNPPTAAVHADGAWR